MNDQNDAKKYQPTEQTKLSLLIKDTWRIYKAHFWLYNSFFIFTMVAQVLLTIGLLAAFGLIAVMTKNQFQDFNFGLVIGGFIFIILVFGLVQAVCLGAAIRAASLNEKQQKASFGKVLGESFQRFGKMIGLSLRYLGYTAGWAVLLLFLVFLSRALVATLPQESNISFQPILGAYDSISPILPFVFIAIFVFYIIRTCRAIFCFPILMTSDDSSKQALDESIQLSKGIVGRIFWNGFLISLLAAILAGIFSQLVIQIIGLFLPHAEAVSSATSRAANAISMANISALVGIIPQIIVLSFTAVFNYVFVQKARKEKAGQGMILPAVQHHKA